MIEEIEIGNFRAFSKPVTVRLRPITVLIGKNNAGKSTLLKFLLMLRQTVESRGGGFFPQFLATEGRHVALGALKFLQNGNPGFRGTRLGFRVRLRSPEGPSAPMLQLLEKLKRREDSGNGLSVPAPDLPSANKVLKDETAFDIQAELLYRSPAVGRQVVTGSQAGQQLFEFKSQSLKDVRFLSFPSTTSRPEGELEAIARNTFLRPAREILSGMRHLSPVREELQPDREHANPPVDEVGHRGEFTYYHLYRILNLGGDKADFLEQSVARVAHVDQLEFKRRARDFESHFRGRNRDTEARCHLTDFGFGVSQLIPIFVQGALLQRGQLLMVQQPEAQVHPTAQLELGSFFSDLWKTFGVPSLVETHSANIILRLRQLISNQQLAANDVSIALFTTESRRVEVRNLDIYPDGRLEKGLPREFFGADVLELANFGIPE